MSRLRQREQIPFFCLFCSIQTLNGLGDALLHWRAQSPLLSLPFQMLIASGNTLTDTSGINVLPIIQASFTPVEMT